MLQVCELYAQNLNLVFSTDSNPKKSKSKTIFMTGKRLKNSPKPVPLQLYGKDLPIVESATHLGHELHQDASMDYDCKCKRAIFIDKSTTIRESFGFANEEQILSAIKVYCCDFYGSMLWNLYSEQTEKYFRCWNTCVKLCWDLPRSTHTYFVDSFLSHGLPSIRQQILARYPKFYSSLLTSPSKEVAVMARIVGCNASTTTGSNLLNIFLETRLCPKTKPFQKLCDTLLQPKDIPPTEEWRIALLEKYLSIRKIQTLSCENTSFIDKYIGNLCST